MDILAEILESTHLNNPEETVPGITKFPRVSGLN